MPDPMVGALTCPSFAPATSLAFDELELHILVGAPPEISIYSDIDIFLTRAWGGPVHARHATWPGMRLAHKFRGTWAKPHLHFV